MALKSCKDKAEIKLKPPAIYMLLVVQDLITVLRLDMECLIVLQFKYMELFAGIKGGKWKITACTALVWL